MTINTIIIVYLCSQRLGIIVLAFSWPSRLCFTFMRIWIAFLELRMLFEKFHLNVPTTKKHKIHLFWVLVIHIIDFRFRFCIRLSIYFYKITINTFVYTAGIDLTNSMHSNLSKKLMLSF